MYLEVWATGGFWALACSGGCSGLRHSGTSWATVSRLLRSEADLSSRRGASPRRKIDRDRAEPRRWTTWRTTCHRADSVADDLAGAGWAIVVVSAGSIRFKPISSLAG